jgi:hypothetical protein
MLMIFDPETRSPQSPAAVDALTTPRIGHRVASSCGLTEGALQGLLSAKTTNRPRPALLTSAKEEE